MASKPDKLKKVAARKHGGAIPAGVTQLRENASTDSEHPVFSFKHACQNDCLLSSCQAEELDELMRVFKLMESLPWKEVLQHGSLDYKEARGIVLRPPESVSQDAVICSLRVTQKYRLFGHRVRNVFHVIWFDRNHKVVPLGKSKAKR